ncbi:DEAD/DEAH box helicase [Neptunomonas sp.]|uniref:DEAD/DEAH box helicase n=1 Tax=Neptunomonas sp. TaxID=1971898 RepID=UPI00356170D9
MAKLSLQYDLVPGGVDLFLNEEKRTVLLKRISQRLDVAKWDVQDDLHALSGLAKLAALIEATESGVKQSGLPVKILPEGDGYFIPHHAIAEFTEGQALSLGFPSSIPFQLRITTTGPLLEPDTKIRAKWFATGRPVQDQRIGAIVEVGEAQYRVPEPIYSALNAIDAFNEFNEPSVDERMENLAGLSQLLRIESAGSVDLENTLKDLRISHATAFSLDLIPSASGIDFNPFLFGQEVLDEVEETGEQITDSAHLLSPKQQEQFAHSLFKRYESARPTYVIDKGTYLYIDPSLRPALEIVREQQQADPDSRRNFVKNPAGFIKQRILGDDIYDPELSDALENLFVETTGFSDRVKELGLWIPKAIPWLKREPNTWLPEKFGIRLGDKMITVDEHGIDTAINTIQEGLDTGKTTVTLPDGNSITPSADAIMAFETLKQEIQSPEKPPSAESDEAQEPDADSDAKDASSKYVLIVEENVEEVSFLKNFKNRVEFAGPVISALLQNTPKEHQVTGIGWLQECWAKGFPGALLADDMGLGKTFQTLGFLAWLQDKRRAMGLPKQPVLIVAPTSLLNNWMDEETLHLFDPGLGSPGLLFGTELKRYKEKGRSNDIAEGVSTLNTADIMECDWLLTTYETLRDYQISIGKLKLSCVVFDEIQKVKNPRSLSTNASKTLNADFTLGLTGTPIENSLSDLWCICDTLIPGFLGDLKSFMNDYPEDDHAKLSALHTALLERSEHLPQPILRRMKADILKDLPAKIEHLLDESMVGYQASCYDDLIKRVKREEEPKGARLIHKFRGISLHPNKPDSEESNDADKYIADSARLRVVFKQLDQIAQKNQKVLIFLESLAMQEWLAFVIKHRYGFKHLPPRIYGGIPAVERKRIVDRFQERKNLFGVMILSPKAGGVGLTITAATNVIHLSRWWNPAVEDQCTDRAYRIGQDQEVNVYIPRAIHPSYGNGSFDVILHDLLERKKTLSKTMLIPMEGKQDMNYIFSKIE